jgi:Zn-dependent M28 family amino/carboxypeptidase
MKKNHAMKSFPLASRISFRGKFKERDFTANNVIGMLEGSDPELKDTYLCISSHYDHLGIGPEIAGDSIYNGVFDNAAGVAAQLEVARVLGNLSKKPKRSIIFLFLTGEEKGLLGSTYYTDHPMVPLYRTVANINIDGLAMFDTFKDVVGIGAELSDLELFLENVCRYLYFKISPVPTPLQFSEAFAHSDQISFAKAGIPSMLIVEGLNLTHFTRQEAFEKIVHWMNNYYHTPFDDLNQMINYPAATQHTEVILATCYIIANSATTPEWNPGIKYKTIRLQTIAEKR